MRVLGVDVGTKHLGFAIGDGATQIASPLYAKEVKGTVVESIVAVVKEERCDVIVLGDPRTAEGEQTPASKKVEALAAELRAQLDVSVELVTEHLTSKIATALAEETGASQHDDALAAMLILEEYFGQQS